jgi:hypothetical protein
LREPFESAGFVFDSREECDFVEETIDLIRNGRDFYDCLSTITHIQSSSAAGGVNLATECLG